MLPDMSPLDWIVVVALNGVTIGIGIWISRGARNSSDWFLAGRTLPWWAIGFSLYATAIDSSDLVADSGGVYTLGLSYFVTNWMGVILGWLLSAHVVTLVMYRQGMYTNAEYLEARFGPSARIISALVQIQYRTMVLGIIANTLYLTLAIVCGWGQGAWLAVGLIALIATVYTMWGGLKSVVITDALQSLIMLAAGFVLFALVWGQVGGWEGARSRLDQAEPGLAAQLLHTGHDQSSRIDVRDRSPEEIETELRLGGRHDASTQTITRTTPAWLVCLAFVIAGMAYSIVNHTQSMRLLGARSVWDLKMAAVVSCTILLVVNFVNLSIGVFGRALFPDPSLMPLADLALQKPDAIYPLLVRDLVPIGLKGLVVAGVLAASFSTFDSIGSTLSALVTRDLYARLWKRDGADQHYLTVGRWLTPVIIFGSFAYLPFLQSGGMLLFYLDLVGAFVVPLLTVYLMGTLTGVHRRTGALGLAFGVAYGIFRLTSPMMVKHLGFTPLPVVMLDGFAAYPWSVVMTAVPMVLGSFVWGWQSASALQTQEGEGWLSKSRAQIGPAPDDPGGLPNGKLPLVLGLLLLGIGTGLSLIVFW